MAVCECFTIDVSVQNSKPFVDTDKKSVLQFPKRTAFSLFYPEIMQADPFLFVYNSRLFLFYEEMLLGRGLGFIKMVSTTDLKHWTKPVTITHDEKCHFSYPFVFEEGGEIYMMPETGCDHNIRLYKAVNDDLTRFELYKVILARDKEPENLHFDFADSSLYKKGNTYYLFTSYCDDKTYYLELYTSSSFDGDYKLHPESPICVSNKYGRCAGSLIEADGKLYRPTQDCEIVYGGQVHIMEIDELTLNTYKEHLVKENVIPQEQEYYKEGGHQVNFAEFNGQTVIATDVRFTTSFLLERIRLKIMKLLYFYKNK